MNNELTRDNIYTIMMTDDVVEFEKIKKHKYVDVNVFLNSIYEHKFNISKYMIQNDLPYLITYGVIEELVSCGSEKMIETDSIFMLCIKVAKTDVLTSYLYNIAICNNDMRMILFLKNIDCPYIIPHRCNLNNDICSNCGTVYLAAIDTKNKGLFDFLVANNFECGNYLLTYAALTCNYEMFVFLLERKSKYDQNILTYIILNNNLSKYEQNDIRLNMLKYFKLNDHLGKWNDYSAISSSAISKNRQMYNWLKFECGIDVYCSEAADNGWETKKINML